MFQACRPSDPGAHRSLVQGSGTPTRIGFAIARYWGPGSGSSPSRPTRPAGCKAADGPSTGRTRGQQTLSRRPKRRPPPSHPAAAAAAAEAGRQAGRAGAGPRAAWRRRRPRCSGPGCAGPSGARTRGPRSRDECLWTGVQEGWRGPGGSSDCSGGPEPREEESKARSEGARAEADEMVMLGFAALCSRSLGRSGASFLGIDEPESR